MTENNAKVIDNSFEDEIASSLVPLLLEDGGYTPAEALGGLIATAFYFISMMPDAERALTEIVDEFAMVDVEDVDIEEAASEEVG